jgi:hypothetical protein
MPLFRFGKFFEDLRALRIFLGTSKGSVQGNAVLLSQEVVRVAPKVVFRSLHSNNVSDGN